ncbi:MAG: carbon-nitrogen hydrolase family protein [Bacteroidota bacterium]
MRIAIIQHPPVYLDLNASLDKAAMLLEQAAAKGAELTVFGETWLSGYPAWLDHCPEVAMWDHPVTKKIFARMYQSSISLGGEAFGRLQEMAKRTHMYLVIGVNERIDQGPGNGTIYNSLLTFGPDGRLRNHHRKLMPTYSEKLLYGQGDGHGLITLDTDWGRLGGLICWEHWMPHARQALHNAGEHIHIAVWPTVHELHQLASRHYAVEGRCFVIAAGQLLAVKDLPAELTLPPKLQDQPEHLLLRGGSCIIGPDGQYVLEAVMDKAEILIADIEPNKVLEERMTLDVSGHYQRPDIFAFHVNTDRK